PRTGVGAQNRSRDLPSPRIPEILGKPRRECEERCGYAHGGVRFPPEPVGGIDKDETMNSTERLDIWLDPESCYRAVKSRDRRFDGVFYTAVRTTGIYCRPSCPARTPAFQNVTFHPSAASAQAAGYRACKRCLPDATPGSPD